jgi:hypothetical protein
VFGICIANAGAQHAGLLSLLTQFQQGSTPASRTKTRDSDYPDVNGIDANPHHSRINLCLRLYHPVPGFDFLFSLLQGFRRFRDFPVSA